MKIPNFWSEVTMTTVLLILLLLFLDPFMVVMSHTLVYMAICLLILFFVLFAGLVWREGAVDEREVMHRMMASRAGYLAGMAVLIIMVIVETIGNHPKTGLILALMAMIVAKMITSWYVKSNL